MANQKGDMMGERAGLSAPSRPRILRALGTVSLLLLASTGLSDAATDRPDAVSAITLVEQRVIEIANSQLISLSPDGGSIAVTRPAGPEPTELCIHDVVTLAERACADVSGLDAGLWADSAVWAPDSERLPSSTQAGTTSAPCSCSTGAVRTSRRQVAKATT